MLCEDRHKSPMPVVRESAPSAPILRGVPITFEVSGEEATTAASSLKEPMPAAAKGLTCRVVLPAERDACGKPASVVVKFSGNEGGSTHACAPCARSLEQLALSHGTSVKVEKIT